MGFLEPHVRHRGRDGRARLTRTGLPPGCAVFVVAGIAEARLAVDAAAACDTPAVLLSLPSAAASAGVGWFRALVAAARSGSGTIAVDGAIDCGDFAGYALSALRQGFPFVVYRGTAMRPVSEIAAARNAVVLGERPPALDLVALSRTGRDLRSPAMAWALGAKAGG